jgi:hypothetical protein
LLFCGRWSWRESAWPGGLTAQACLHVGSFCGLRLPIISIPFHPSRHTSHPLPPPPPPTPPPLPPSFLLTHQQLLYDRETWPHLSLIAVILRPLSLLSPPLFSLLVTRLTYLSPPASALASLYLIPPPYTPPRPPLLFDLHPALACNLAQRPCSRRSVHISCNRPPLYQTVCSRLPRSIDSCELSRPRPQRDQQYSG